MSDQKKNTRFALVVLFGINFMNFFDRQIAGALGEPIRIEFGLNDTQLGLLATVFTLVYAFVGVPIGPADRQLVAQAPDRARLSRSGACSLPRPGSPGITRPSF